MLHGNGSLLGILGLGGNDKPAKGKKMNVSDWWGRLFPKTEVTTKAAIENDAVAAGSGVPLPLVVTKEASGHYRWFMTVNPYQDRDGEWLTQQALTNWVASLKEVDSKPTRPNGQTIVHRFWHMGSPDPLTGDRGAGVDLGEADFVDTHGKSVIASGLFYSDAVGAKMAQHADALGGSPGYFHSKNEPQDGAFRALDIFELTSLEHAYASNPFNAVAVAQKELPMNKLDEFKKLVGTETAAQVLARAELTEKQAEALGVTYKAAEAPPAKKKKADDAEDAADQGDDETAEDKPKDTPVVAKKEGDAPAADPAPASPLVETIGSWTPAQLGDVIVAVISRSNEAVLTATTKEADLLKMTVKELADAQSAHVKEIGELSKKLDTATKELGVLKGDLPAAVRGQPSASGGNLIQDALRELGVVVGADGKPIAVTTKAIGEGSIVPTGLDAVVDGIMRGF